MRAFRIVLLGLLASSIVAAGRAQDNPPPVSGTGGDLSSRVLELEAENKRLRAEADFTSRRMALLEAEAERLRGLVKSRQDADSLAADRATRLNIVHDVERLRGLHFLQPVDYREIPRSELPTILRQKLAQQVPDTEFENAGVALSALGLLPANIDLKKTYLALLGEQIGAFYDQHEKQLFTFSGQPLSASQNRVIMAHELTHALEDQHFNLSRLPIEAKGNDDRVLAATALVEGDATLVMNRYMVGDLSASAVRDALASTMSTDVRQLASAPRYLRETLLFPYLRGQEFCDALYARGAWDALAEAFRRPPASSSQILHPELYFADPREEPVEISFPEGEIAGQKPVEDNVLGEFGARELFLQWLHDKHQSEDDAAGWRGDRYLVYQHDKATSYVWKTLCRDREAAERFYHAVCLVDAARYQSLVTREKQVMPMRNRDGQVIEGKALALMAGHPPGREIRVCVTPANEVIAIDAQETVAAALCERFAPGISFSGL